MVQEQSFRQVAVRLSGPIYVPSVLAASASTALVPMLALVAIRLGFSPALAALIVGVLGLVSILGPIPIAVLMERLGERPAMVLGGAMHIVGCLVAVGLLAIGPGAWTRIGLVMVVLGLAVTAEIWDLGRVTSLSAHLPLAHRGRAMNLFGGVLRIGAVIGPSLGAAAFALAGFAGFFLISLALMAAATWMVHRYRIGESALEKPSAAPVNEAEESKDRGLSPHVVRAMTVVAIGLTALILTRVNVAVLLPLVGHQAGLSPTAISMVFGIGAAVEVLLFFPAGMIVDRLGRGTMAGLCCAGLALGFVVLAGMPSLVRQGWSPIAVFATARVVIALGNCLGSGIIKTLGVDLAPSRRRAAHLGFYNSLTGVGVLAGPALVSLATTAVGLTLASALTGGVALAGAAYLALLLPRYTPGFGGRAPNFDPDRPSILGRSYDARS